MSRRYRFGPDVLTTAEVANAADVSIQKVTALIRNGTLPVYRQAGLPPLIPIAAVTRWLSGQRAPENGYIFTVVQRL